MILLLSFLAGMVAGISANVVASLLEKWLEERPRFRKLSIGHRLGLTVVVFTLASAAAFYLQYTSQGSTNFEYLVRVQSNETGEAISNARVTIEIGGIAPLDEFTDSNGVARFRIDAAHAGNPARLIVDAAGFLRFVQNTDLVEDLPPKTIRLEPAS